MRQAAHHCAPLHLRPNAGTFLANAGLVQASALPTWKPRNGCPARSATPPCSTKPPAAPAAPRTCWGEAGGGSTSEGTSTHLAAQPLLAPDEAMRLLPHAQVLLRPGQFPALVSKLRHYADAEFAGLADE